MEVRKPTVSLLVWAGELRALGERLGEPELSRPTATLLAESAWATLYEAGLSPCEAVIEVSDVVDRALAERLRGAGGGGE